MKLYLDAGFECRFRGGHRCAILARSRIARHGARGAAQLVEGIVAGDRALHERDALSLVRSAFFVARPQHPDLRALVPTCSARCSGALCHVLPDSSERDEHENADPYRCERRQNGAVESLARTLPPTCAALGETGQHQRDRASHETERAPSGCSRGRTDAEHSTTPRQGRRQSERAPAGMLQVLRLGPGADQAAGGAPAERSDQEQRERDEQADPPGHSLEFCHTRADRSDPRPSKLRPTSRVLPTMSVPRRDFLVELLLSFAALGLPACGRARPRAGASRREVPIPAKTQLASVVLPNVPHVRQKPDFCGEAATASWLGALGKRPDQDAVFDASGMDPSRGMGVTTRELAASLEKLGFSPGEVWHSVRADSAAAELAKLFQELHADLARGVPSIVCMHYDERPDTTEHFRLVLGYDADKDEVVYHEPALDSGAYQRMSRARFLALWPLVYEPERWTVIRLRLAAGSVAVPDKPSEFRPAEYAQHVIQLKEGLDPALSLTVEAPFVVIGDGGPARVRQSAESTVRWAVRLLRQDFFARPPLRILNVWLLSTPARYEKVARSLTGEDPGTPYGFYSRRARALVMNISTGGGTLVHEIVHPFIEANFPACPPWFNEGLGSLFEQSAERDGHIVGLPNWRLSGLKRAIGQKKVPDFRTLLAKNGDEFYGDDSGVNYAASRYLCHYLQDQGVLRSYYREFTLHQPDDPSGHVTLLRVLGERDARAFEARWRTWVLGLSFTG